MAYHNGTSSCLQSKLSPSVAALTCALLFHAITLPPAAASAATQRLGPFHPTALRNFVSARCNSNSNTSQSQSGGAAVWSYEGSLIDPTNGRIVAEVEGIELCRHLSDVAHSAPSVGSGTSEFQKRTTPSLSGEAARGLRRMGSLKARDMLLDGMKSPDRNWDYATTVLSRRMFLYRAPTSDVANSNGEGTSKSNPSFSLPPSLLRSIRFRPNSPEKKLAVTDSVAVYDTATTYVSRNNGRSMSILTEFPNGNWVMGRTDADGRGNEQSNFDTFDFAVYARMGGSGGMSVKARNMPSLVPIRIDSTSSKARRKSASSSSPGGSVVISPPRSKLIQFGKDNSVERARYGVRETYSYDHMTAESIENGVAAAGDMRMSAPSNTRGIGKQIGNLASRARQLLLSSSKPATAAPTVRYTRYGESPPWYRPSQPATLELRGKRIPSLESVPSLPSSIAARFVPGFFAVDCPIPKGPSAMDANVFMGKRAAKNKLDTSTIERLQDEADAAATRAVEWFRNPSSNGADIVTLLDENNESDEYEDPFASAGNIMKLKRRMKRTARSAIASGGTIVGRIWDATVIRSTAGSAGTA